MCPHCGEPLVILELEGVEIDHCMECGGTWLDTGELELLLEIEGSGSHRLSDELLSAEPINKTKRKCPRCSTKLREIRVGRDPAVEIDRCPHGHGIWLDRGEIRAIIEQFHEGEIGTVARFFKNLYHDQVKQTD